MWHDPVVEEIRKRREKHAAKFKYNTDAIIKALQIDEKKVAGRLFPLRNYA